MGRVDVRYTSSRCRERGVVRGCVTDEKGLRPTRRGEYVDHWRAGGCGLASGSFGRANWRRGVYGGKRLLGPLRRK